MIRSLLCFALLLCAVLTTAEEHDLRGQTEHNAGYILADGTFASGENGWSNIDGKQIRVEPNGGVNGSPALRYERTDSGDYTLVTRPLKLRGGRAYRFGGVIRNENVKGSGGNVVIELYRNGKYLRNLECPTSAGANCDWTPLEYTISIAPGEDDCTAVIHLYMPRGSTGVTWFDRVFVEELGPRWQIDQTYPTHNVIDAAGGPFRAYSELKGSFALPESARAIPDYEVEFQLNSNGKILTKSARPAGHIVETNFGKLPEGSGTLRSRLYDRANKLLLAESTRQVEIRDRMKRASSNSCVIDEHGRAIVDGKPYLPIGLYFGVPTREEIDLLAASPFNCIMPYGSMEMAGVMDYLAEKDIKVIFSIKDVHRSNPRGEDDYSFRGMRGADEVAKFYVETFRNHPALLAWYICDEMMVDWLPLLTERRQMVNKLDPDHPTWAVFYQPNVADYLPMLDLFGGDQYPISRISEGYDHHMTSIDRLMGYAEATGVPTWNVPQAHNLNTYSPADKAADYRDPTGEEILALSLVQAIHGGKGFVFYSFFDFSKGPNRKEAPELFGKRWKEACMAAGELRKLEPFLLSGLASPALAIETETGKLRARCFADGNGNYRLLIAGVGPGRTAGKIRVELPAGLEMRSRSGLTTRLADGSFAFSGNDITSDIVELTPAK